MLNPKEYSYVLITPARNEDAYIEKTIKSVVSQTVLPKKWVIVSDGSTDRTDNIVKKYLADNSWITFLRMPDNKDRDFAAKVNAFNMGYQKVKNLKYDLIGNLDADISFEEDYFEFLLGKFAEIPELGVAGTPYMEGESHSFRDSYVIIYHVHGQCQVFRRECFEDIGGYTPIKLGGIDWVAVTTARMKGWKTYSFQEKIFRHHRKMNTANNNVLMSRFRYGQKDYCLGWHPLWEIFRTFYQMTRKPYFIGGLFLLAGYAWAFLTRVERPVSQQIMMFHRSEQMQRLKVIIYKNKKMK